MPSCNSNIYIPRNKITSSVIISKPPQLLACKHTHAQTHLHTRIPEHSYPHRTQVIAVATPVANRFGYLCPLKQVCFDT